MRRPVLAALALVSTTLAVATGGAGGAVAGAQTADSTSSTESAAPAATIDEVVVTGHGWGHGRGLGQFGSYGYAKDHGWSYEEITGHFYGGTSLGTADNAPLDVLLKSYGTGWTIAFLESGTIVTSIDDQLEGGANPARRAIAVEWLGGDSFRVYEGDSCTGMAGGPFQELGTFTATEIEISTASPGTSRVELLGACEFNGAEPKGHRYVRGSLVADSFSTATDPTVRQRTMNRILVEEYLRSVVPAESPSSWGGDGTAPGMHALRSQAIAARSYVLAGDTRWGNADSCDDVYCQVYKGFGYNAAGVVSLYESTNGDLAVAQTAGQVRRNGSGGIARTEFSSSTGGYTAGGAFPAVVDDGDAVSSNPNHNWEARLPVSGIEAALDARAGRDLGAFERFVVLERNGLGADGGRVRSVRAELTNGDLTLTGDQFRSTFQKYGVKSDWFVVQGQQTTTYFSDTAGHTHEENIDKIAEAEIAGGYPDGTFRPDESVTRGQMATFLTRGYHLPAAASPTFSDIAGDTHEANIRAVANAGVATGYPDGTYKPTNPVTRGQMAAFLARAEQLPLDSTASDLCDVEGHPFAAEIVAIVDAGIASGTSDGCFHPDDPVTRGQMATFLARALGL